MVASGASRADTMTGRVQHYNHRRRQAGPCRGAASVACQRHSFERCVVIRRTHVTVLSTHY
eukprot:6201680-Pleurochrysis_carterae.AAC.1